MAADCFVPVQSLTQGGMSVAAPEMLRPAVIDPFCISARDLPAEPATSAAPASPAAYVPRTKDDNSPWRFDMSQNGKRMTSAEFDAWMKAKGIRVATGKPGTADAPAAAQAPATAPSAKGGE
jgi:hypothetical protein